MFGDVITALIYWPAITYFAGVLGALVGGTLMWCGDEQVKLTLVVRTAVLWPIVARGVFR